MALNVFMLIVPDLLQSLCIMDQAAEMLFPEYVLCHEILVLCYIGVSVLHVNEF